MKKNWISSSKKEKKYIIFFSVLFFLVLVLGYFFPLAYDDWAWGSSIGIDRLNSSFANYNGRWAGNLFVILITRNRIIRALSIAIIITLITRYVIKVVDCDKNISFIAILLLLLMPLNILTQAVAWVSGFANYQVPILICLIYIYLNRNLFSGKVVEISKKLAIPLLILGFINSLFVEHMTIYNLLLAIGVTVFIFVKTKKIDISNLFYSIGSLMGTILMFSNSGYSNVYHAKDSFRTMASDSFIVSSLKAYFNSIYNLLIHQNVVINIIVCICLLIFAYRFVQKNKSLKKWTKNLLIFSSTILICYLSYIIYTKILGGGNVFIYPTYKKFFEGIMIIFYGFAITALTFFTIEDKKVRNMILFEIASLVLMAAPLLVVKPIGARCFYPTYIMLVIITCQYLGILLKNVKFDFRKFMTIPIFLIMMFNVVIYGYTFKIEHERDNYIKLNKNEKELILPLISFDKKYLMYANPNNAEYERRFKLFYNIDADSKLTFISYPEWVKKQKENK